MLTLITIIIVTDDMLIKIVKNQRKKTICCVFSRQMLVIPRALSLTVQHLG